MPISPHEKRNIIERQELITLLTPTLGEEKSEELIREAAISLGIPLSRFNVEQAFSIFELLAATEGLVGIVAQLAKARLRLVVRFGSNGPESS